MSLAFWAVRADQQLFASKDLDLAPCVSSIRVLLI